MTPAPAISLDIEELGINGLGRAEAVRLGAALERELHAQLGDTAGLSAPGPIALDRLQIALPQRASPEAMAAGIARQLVGAMSAPGASRKTSGGGAP
ncbi:hypothetical protein [Parerythrobacter lacustris]|uniref:Uncharacterized protein n=1 Tax=Parerythrobacter lacustris TaxID=2969984 RepID=A0ABT1XUD8_9SPHN|nr:hypothetical protein [Parerythrobacter lacustris]MCR2835279.1 hypothetical protein [Parerythrobacter lacustris]